MDWRTTVRAGLGQALGILVVALVLAAALDRAFFEEWGWLAGPGAWLAVAAGVATALRLPLGGALVGAVLAGLPQLVFVVLGVHWGGAPLGILLFALWCGRLRREPALADEVV